jgi:UDP-N-acetylmuramoyl-L-alanyl-D-glutamate--2,6-diaminopimelate ligase
VTSVCYDSRQCGEGSLFVAVPGLKVDGHRYAAEAVKRGARFIVHEAEVPSFPDAVTLRVRNSREVLGALGKNLFGDPSSGLCLVSVMGTNGKTTVTYLLESIFSAAGYRAGVLGTVNYRYGNVSLPAPNTTPESFEMHRILREMADAGTTHVAAEVSSHAVDLRRVDDCDFDMGIFTNLSQDHLDYHGTMERYFAAKKRFFTDILPRSKKGRRVKMIVNQDDPLGKRLLRDAALPAWGFGIDGPCQVRATHYECSLGGIRAEVLIGEDRLHFESPLIGRFNLYNILAATAAALCLDIPPEAITRGVAVMEAVPGRLERINTPGQPSVFVDYAHTDDALTKVLENLLPFRQDRIITVFGCGGDRDHGKRPLMGKAAAMASDLVVLTSDNPRSEDPLEIIRDIQQGIPTEAMTGHDAATFNQDVSCKAYTVIPDRRQAIETAVNLARLNDIILIAGKGHEDYQILGDRKIWFDDRVVAREALSRYFDERRPA